MLIAQLTDTHIRPEGALAYGRVDTARHMEAAVSHILSLDPRPDVVVVTGDLTDLDLPQEYARFRALAARLPMPVLPIPGNHDSSAGLLAAFPEVAARAGGPRAHHVVDAFDLSLVMLDSSVPGAAHGARGADGLAFLEAALERGRDRPALVLLHHPPFKTGIAHMDAQNLRDGAALEAILRRHPQVVGLVCGHVHRAITTTFAGIAATIAPAPAHVVSLDLAPDGPATFHMEPPALALHLWTGDRLVSHVSQIGGYPGPFPFFDEAGRAIVATA
jgi:3',5'-cyclic AMP phosphodiesterase CpdA